VKSYIGLSDMRHNKRAKDKTMDRSGDNLLWNKNILRGLIVLTVLFANTGVSAKSLRADHCQMVWENLASTLLMIHHTNGILDKEYKKPVHLRTKYMKEYERDVLNQTSEAADLSTIWDNACKDHH
jgi:hypothetical protein